jgi:hypothetical protein
MRRTVLLVLVPVLVSVLAVSLAGSASAAPRAGKRAPAAPRESVRAEELKPPTPAGWEVFQDPEGTFSVLLPAHRRTAVAEDDGILVNLVQARADDDCEYAVLWSDGNPPDTAEKLPALLADTADGRGVSTDLGSFEAGQDRRSGLDGRRLHGVSERAEMDLRAYTDGSRLYKLYAVCPKATVTDTDGQAHSAWEFATSQRRAFFASFEANRREVGRR